MGHQMVDFLTDQLRDSQNANGKVLSWTDPVDALKSLSDLKGNDPSELFEFVSRTSIRLHHPKYIGHQISPPLPITAVSSMLVDLLNNGMGVYEMGMGGTAIERKIVEELATKFGMPETADGFFTSGGSLANLTALLAARAMKTDDAVWKFGTQDVRHVVLVSEAAHYCVDRAVRIMGLGDSGIRRVKTNSKFQMCLDDLEKSIEELSDEGRVAIAVVASACSTSTGSYDDLDGIASICQANKIWLHVDGAHGVPVVFSRKYRHLVRGISRADSVTMDFHKLLMVPAVTSALVFRNSSDAYRTFSLQAEYLFDNRDQEEWFNLARRTFECTKQMIGLKVMSIIHTYGTEIFEQNVDQLYDLTRSFAILIQQDERFELALEPESNILCFRYLETKHQEHCELNAKIRTALVKDGKFYIVQTMLDGQTWLRTTVANPFTSNEDFQQLLDEIGRWANSILREEQSTI